MKKLALLVLLCAAASVAAAQDTALDFTQGWKTTVDLGYTCKYIWRGFDILDDAGAFQPSVDFQHESGFGANLWMSYPDRGGSTEMVDSRVDLTEFDYTVYYNGTAFEGSWETNYSIGWRYYDLIRRSSRNADAQEIFLEFEMPQLTGTPLIPHAGIYQYWPAHGGGDNSDVAGTFYLMGFSYLLPTEEQLPDVPLTFSWDIMYDDGAGANNVDSDWSYMLWGLKTEFDCPMTGGTITPYLYFQNSFERSVNTEDELWGGVTYSIAF